MACLPAQRGLHSHCGRGASRRARRARVLSPTCSSIETIAERIRRSNNRLRSLISVADAGWGPGVTAFGRAASDGGMPAGIPFAVKDNIDVAGFVTTCGWPGWSDAPARRSAGLVEALQQAGAVAVAKANMPPLAFGATGRNEFYGTVLNPADEATTPGGSSSGSARTGGAFPRRPRAFLR
ncbi:MAG: amidase family protein [Spirochaetaceae bacterium]